MKKHWLCAIALITLSNLSPVARADIDLSMSRLKTDGAISNAATAKRIAVAILTPYFTKSYVASLNDKMMQSEWSASLSADQKWTVTQKWPEGSLATGYVVILDKQNGGLISAYFQQ